MTEEPKQEDSQIGYFLIFLLLWPLMLFGMFFATIGIGLYKLIVSDRELSILKNRPDIDINIYYTFVGGAVVFGFYLMFWPSK